MDNDFQTTNTGKKNMTIKIVMPILALIILAGLIIWLTAKPAANTAVIDQKKFKDGSYSAVGYYQAPDGEQSIGISLSLKNNLIQSATATNQATAPASQKWQDRFIAGFNEQVVGQSIDQLSLTVVNGSSLTTQGFNDALTKIKTQSNG